MAKLNEVREGMQVYDTNNRSVGTVEEISDSGIMVNGKQLTRNMIARVENGVVYLSGNLDAFRVPLSEERLNVDKRQVDQGAVKVHKTVQQENVSVPVELRREDAKVESVDFPDRPIRPGDNVFKEQTYEMPLSSEEAVVSKQAIMTGEVVVNKEQQTERRNISDTVRQERVNVDQGGATSYQANPTYDYQAQKGSNSNSTYATSAAYGQSGTALNGQIRTGTTVYSSDDDNIGQVKEVSGNEILVDRKLQRDIYVPSTAIQQVNNEKVMLNVPSDQIDSMGWRNP